MRTIEYRTTHVPAFLTKLWKLVTDPSSDDLISWSVGGTSFIIYDEIRFAKELLPMYFKHNNMASFVRQLNMYGFRKLSCIDQGGMHSLKHEIEFYHQYFIKDQETLLELIKRKIPSNRSSEEARIKPEYVKELISNLKYLQGKQQTSDEGIKNLRKENKMLWRHITLMNNRFMKQQAMLQQVLPFFMNMMQSAPRLPLKRRPPPLMIHEGESEVKASRIETPYYVEHIESDMNSELTSSPGNVSNRGPVIHEVTEMESNKIFADNILCSPNGPKENDVIVDSPLSSLGSSEHTMDSPFTESAATAENMEPLNVLNCNFESLNSINPPTEMLPPRQIATPPQLLVQDTGLSSVASQMGSLNSMSPPMQTVTMRQDCPPAVAAASASTVNMSASTSFAPQAAARSSPQKNISVIDILNEASNQGSATSAAMQQQQQAIENILNWLPPTVVENEQNLDNWLGQLFTDDNLVAGASLPSKVG